MVSTDRNTQQTPPLRIQLDTNGAGKQQLMGNEAHTLRLRDPSVGPLKRDYSPEDERQKHSTKPSPSSAHERQVNYLPSTSNLDLVHTLGG